MDALKRFAATAKKHNLLREKKVDQPQKTKIKSSNMEGEGEGMSNKEIGEQGIRQIGLYGTPTGSSKNMKTDPDRTQYMPALPQKGNTLRKPSSGRII